MEEIETGYSRMIRRIREALKERRPAQSELPPLNTERAHRLMRVFLRVKKYFLSDQQAASIFKKKYADSEPDLLEAIRFMVEKFDTKKWRKKRGDIKRKRLTHKT